MVISAQRIVTRRNTVAESVAPVATRNPRNDRNDHDDRGNGGDVGSGSGSNRNNRPVPNLVPLKSILKMPARSPISRRKSLHAPATSTIQISTPPTPTPANGHRQQSNRTVLVKGSTLRMILNRINSTPRPMRDARDEPSTSTGGSTGPSNPNFVRSRRFTHESDDSDSE